MKIDAFPVNLGIGDHPGLRIGKDVVGYRNYTFGCKVTPFNKASIRNLAHELAHAAQFGPRNFKYRARVYGFDFRTRQVRVLGKLYAEPRTPKATLRELDTCAYQVHLMEIAGVRFNRHQFFKESAHLLTTYMCDWYCIPGDDQYQRQAWCVEKLAKFYSRRKPETVLHRLRGWLDETEKFLALEGLATLSEG